MKIGIDSYCYHRFFGEIYPEQQAPSKSMTLEDFLRRAHELQVDGISLESCFMPRLDTGYLTEIRGLLDSYNLDRVFAWGHPDGLEGGANLEAYRDMIRCFQSARDIGAKVMRVVGSSFTFCHDQAVARSVDELLMFAKYGDRDLCPKARFLRRADRAACHCILRASIRRLATSFHARLV